MLPDDHYTSQEDETRPLVVDPRDVVKASPRLRPTDQMLEVPLCNERPDRVIKIGSKLSEKEQTQLINLLRENANVFAWSSRDIMGIDPRLAQHL
ncbi:hypothetical protein BHM03_00025368 [Ensete ventricosum]|nr:hypothetical protein BHM03_00025368 [Ensete ventricosum]